MYWFRLKTKIPGVLSYTHLYILMIYNHVESTASNTLKKNDHILRHPFQAWRQGILAKYTQDEVSPPQI